MIEDASPMDRAVVRRRQPRLLALAAAGAVLLITLLVLAPSISRWIRAERSIDAKALRYATVTRGDLLREISVQGRVVASRSPTLFTPGPGIVTIRSRAGAAVKQGDVLATVESPELQSALDQARAELLSMRAEADRQAILARQAKLRAEQQIELLILREAADRRQLERITLLFGEGLSNRSDLEAAQDNLRITEMELQQARTELALSGETQGFERATLEQLLRRQASIVSELQNRVGELTVRAPFDGMVAAYSVADSDAVASNQPIVQVVNLSSLEVEIALPEAYGSETGIGTPAVITFEGRDYPGAVTAVAPEVVNSQVLATVAFDGERPADLRQNQRLSTRLRFESKENVLKTPRGAFLEAGGGRVAYVVDGKMAMRRQIRTGVSSVAQVEIVEGLEEGEKIVLSDITPFGDAGTVMLR
jgi:HlyD family secretion protein